MRFRLVDAITTLDVGRTIETRKAVSFEEFQIDRRRGRDDVWPVSLLVEAMLQSGNWLLMASTDFSRLGLVVQIKHVDVSRPVGRGEMVRFRIDLRSVRSSAVLLEGRGWVGDEQVIHGRGCLATLVPLHEYEDVADMRVLFEELAPGLEAGVEPALMVENIPGGPVEKASASTTCVVERGR